MHKKEQQHLIRGKDKTNNEISSNRIKMEQDSNIYM